MNETAKTKGQLLQDNLTAKKENIFEKQTDKLDAIFSYAEGYKAFLNAAKTEREAVCELIGMAKKNGFAEWRLGDPVKAGGAYYFNNRDKNLFLFRIGTEDIARDGVRIMAAHIDSPRLDLKQVPVYEKSGMCFFKTHYYGGIKKYQWTTIPLSLHGVVVLENGEEVTVKIGEEECDPVFYINDLLPHLAQKQSEKPLGTAIPGEKLNLLVGGVPYPDQSVGDRIKLNVLSILNEKYGIREDDFVSAEISAVPAFKARDVGFDRAFIGAYGHDDRVCAYPIASAIFETKDRNHTTLVILADKEEVGSDGNTGMNSIILRDVLDSISSSLGTDPILVRSQSMCLSADVTAAFDPNFEEDLVFELERKNNAMISCGTTMCKYTGSRGKSSTNDASAEFVGTIRRLFKENGVTFQTAELGRIDVGGGGTVAKYISQINIDTVDIGVPVISMHAPYEVISKADLYSTYEAFAAFCKVCRKN